MRRNTVRLAIAASSFVVLGLLASTNGQAETSIAGPESARQPAVDLSVYYARQLGMLAPTATSFGQPAAEVAQVVGSGQRTAQAAASPVPAPRGAGKIVLALADVPRVSSSKLGTMRAGFALPNGVLVNFGFDSATFLNGSGTPIQVFNVVGSASGSLVTGNVTTQSQGPSQTVPLTSFNLAPLVTTTPDGLTSIVTAFGGSGLRTVISNQANKQMIQHLQTLNVDISGLSAILSQQVAQSLLNRAFGTRNVLGRH